MQRVKYRYGCPGLGQKDGEVFVPDDTTKEEIQTMINSISGFYVDCDFNCEEDNDDDKDLFLNNIDNELKSKSGCRRVNMNLSNTIFEYVDYTSRAEGISKTQRLNEICALDMYHNMQSYIKTKEAIDSIINSQNKGA